jgi:septum formation protein
MIRWHNPDRQIILASGSPRRKQILEQMGFIFETIVPESIDENKFLEKVDLLNSIQTLALIKADQIAKKRSDALVIGADTIVVKNHTILGKPQNSDDAREMLRFLSNSKHQVITGVALKCESENYFKTAFSCTDVFFRNITDSEIDFYLTKNEYKDKAGAYGIQGQAMIFIDKIVGCYYNVVGLPVTIIINLFNDFIDRKESADV